MAKTKVLTIIVQNEPGAVAAIAKALGSANVNILALLRTARVDLVLPSSSSSG